MPTVSAIICAYTERRWDDLIAAVGSLQQQTHRPDEIIVVIDHNEALYERALQAFPDGQVVRNVQQKGLSGARNSGIAQASGAIIAFMDEDAVADPIWLETLLQSYSHQEVMGVGGQIVPLWLADRPGWFPEEFQWVVGCTYRGMPETTAPVRNLIGCNMSFRREVFETAGTFRSEIGRVDTLPMGCEETELCIRVNQRYPGRYLLYEPRAVVRHRVPAARGTWRYFFSRCYSEGISKALIRQYIGSKDGLSTETSYTLKTLPRGVMLGVSDTLRGDFSGLGRSVAIITGLFITTVGYLRGNLRKKRVTASSQVASSLSS
jgi:GT2 family glycosyltransferase